MRVTIQHFIALQLVILCPVLSGSEEVRVKMSQVIIRSSCQPFNAVNEEYISALLGMALGTTAPAPAQSLYTVSYHSHSVCDDCVIKNVRNGSFSRKIT